MTTNQPSVVDEASFSVRRTIRIDATIEKVWAAITDPAHISQWFGRVELAGAGAGAVGTISWPDRDPIPLRVESIDAPHSVAYRWNNDDALGTSPDALDASRSTVFTFTLEATGGGTQLTVVETGFDATSDPAANMADHAEGWVGELDKLVALLEDAA
ncbi:MAG: SRPBCC domain-containing protein [Pseudolysinimonas sp.]